MKKIFVMGLAALLAVSCSKSNTAVVNAQINGADSKDVMLFQLSVNQMRFTDSLKTDSKGAAKCEVAMPDENPNFYYLAYNGKKLASLVLKAGDKVKVVTDTLGRDVQITGSEESALLQKYDENLSATIASFNAITEQMVKAYEANDQKTVQDLNNQMGRMYVKYKQDMIKSIMQNPYSFANVQALYQSLAPSLPVFADENDRFLFQRVHDSLQTIYPNSVYVKSLEEEIKAVENMRLLSERFSAAGEASFPNIVLPDINAQDVELASLEGKPFILMFWVSADANQKMFNNDLLEVYNKYKSAGLEIYQVSLDSDKTAWATAVKEQKLPWISVCDGKGAASPAVASYNLAAVPAIFVFDRNGDIVTGNNLFTKAGIEAAVKKAVK